MVQPSFFGEQSASSNSTPSPFITPVELYLHPLTKMSMESESEAVAQDFRDALEDLQGFARAEINNLTLIARENTEHGHAISGALQEHIKRIVPQKKLPALYVLDSIVKNVGTPYTLYFGRKLYETFMNAYASVDQATRRKMDEMLKTWKEPIVGSLDTRPVFPPDVTRPIENALIKARTTALQAQREHVRSQQQLLGRGRPVNQGMPQGAPYRETPTPPGVHHPPPHTNYPPQAPTPTTNGVPSTYPHQSQPVQNNYPLHLMQQHMSRSTPQPAPTTMAYQHPQLGGYGAPLAGISVDSLKDSTRNLITAFQARIAQTPHDPSVQSRLKALMDLQILLETQNLPQDTLVMIEKQIAELAVTMRAPAQPAIPTPIPQSQPVAVAPPQQAGGKISLDTLFGPGTLAAIMSRNSMTPQASTPHQPPATIAVPTPPPQRVEPPKPAPTHPKPPPPTDPMALMNMLRQAGMLPPATPASSSTTASNSVPSLPFLPPVQAASANQPTRPPAVESAMSDIDLRPASLKVFRAHLIPSLFESLGPQCLQCGRRFTKDEEGKKKKTAHMDSHFRVNQRLAEAEKQGHHRSWFVDEMDWVKTRETVDEERVVPSGDFGANSNSSAQKAPQMQYIPVPDDPSQANSVCSICQDKFETRWLDDAQEFVWPDTMRVGSKIYHASCYQEAFKDGGNAPAYVRASTPEPYRGKRKAEEELTSNRSKIKAEGA